MRTMMLVITGMLLLIGWQLRRAWRTAWDLDAAEYAQWNRRTFDSEGD